MNALLKTLIANIGKPLTNELADEIQRAVYFSEDRAIDPSQFDTIEYKGFVFSCELFRDVIDEIKLLHAAHWEETEKYRHGLAMNPDYDAYLTQERAGQQVLFTVRHDGELVGQTTLLIFKSRHCQTITAREDAFFLRKDKRGGFTMLRFIKYMHTCLQKLGVREVYVSSKLSNGADKLMIRAGYTPIATQLMMILEDCHVIP